MVLNTIKIVSYRLKMARIWSLKCNILFNGLKLKKAMKNMFHNMTIEDCCSSMKMKI